MLFLRIYSPSDLEMPSTSEFHRLGVQSRSNRKRQANFFLESSQRLNTQFDQLRKCKSYRGKYRRREFQKTKLKWTSSRPGCSHSSLSPLFPSLILSSSLLELSKATPKPWLHGKYRTAGNLCLVNLSIILYFTCNSIERKPPSHVVQSLFFNIFPEKIANNKENIM